MHSLEIKERMLREFGGDKKSAPKGVHSFCLWTNHLKFIPAEFGR